MKRLPIILLSATCLYACEKNDASVSGPVEIALSAVVESSSTGTKAPFELEKPTAENPVTAAIWASTKQGTYRGLQTSEPGPEATDIDYHNSTCFTGERRQILDHPLFYPENKSYVYFVGLCPRSADGWNVYESSSGSGVYNVAHHIFDGKTDVMFAPEVRNNIESSELPTMTFKHCLTWIRFNVVANSDDAVDAWGKIKKITIASKKDININVNTGVCTFSGDDQNALATYCTKNGKYTDEALDFNNKEKYIQLTTSPQEVAYVLCAAVTAGPNDGENEYRITIDTEYRPDTTVDINLKKANNKDNFSGSTEGKQFTVTLNFMLGDNIVTTAQATEWVNGGLGLISIDEK